MMATLNEIYAQAEWEAQALSEAGADGLIVENLGDEPYRVGEPDPIQFALMAAITRQVQQKVAIPVGVNVQFNAWQAEMAIAHACQADFVTGGSFRGHSRLRSGNRSPLLCANHALSQRTKRQCCPLCRHPDKIHYQYCLPTPHPISD